MFRPLHEILLPWMLQKVGRACNPSPTLYTNLGGLKFNAHQFTNISQVN